MRAAILAIVFAAAGAAPAHADPVFGTSLGYGDGLGGEADERMATNIYVYSSLPGGWTLGGEIAGSLEGFDGGYGCGTYDTTGMDVPAVAVMCLQPSVAVHALFGVKAAPSPSTRLRLEGGAGAATLFLVPGQGGQTVRDTSASGLIRAAYLAHLGTGFTGEWWLGLQLEERALGLNDPHLARSIALILEGVSLD
jgi:hypothetical protein